MNIPDLVTMLENLTQSLIPIEQMLKGFAYILGLIFVLTALLKLHKMKDTSGHQSHENTMIPLAYFLAGIVMLILPQATTILSNTTFGSGNILGETTQNPNKLVINTIYILIQTAGVLWFIRGAILLAHSSSPGDIKDCMKQGFLFLCAGILALNVKGTVGIFHTIMTKLAGFFGSSS